MLSFWFFVAWYKLSSRDIPFSSNTMQLFHFPQGWMTDLEEFLLLTGSNNHNYIFLWLQVYNENKNWHPSDGGIMITPQCGVKGNSENQAAMWLRGRWKCEGKSWGTTNPIKAAHPLIDRESRHHQVNVFQNCNPSTLLLLCHAVAVCKKMDRRKSGSTNGYIINTPLALPLPCLEPVKGWVVWWRVTRPR